MTCDGTAFVRIRGRGACHGRSGAGTSGSGSFLGKAVCRAVSVHCMAGAGCTPAGSVCGAAACARASAAAAGAARLAAGYGAGRGTRAAERPQARLRGRGKRSVRTARHPTEIRNQGNKRKRGTHKAAPRESGCRRARLHRRKGGQSFRSITQNSVLRSGEILLPAPARAGRLCVEEAGVGVCALWHLAHYAVWRARTFHWNRPMESSAARKAYAAACRAVRMRRAPGIYANAAVPCPMAVGVLRPVVLVPEALCESPLLEWMLRHELTHIKRGHIVCKAVLLSACAVHWYNPAVWLLARRCEKDLEFACDEAVLHGTKLGAPVRAAYGEALLAALKGRHPRRSPPALRPVKK